MSHIIYGKASENEISNFIGEKPVVSAYAKNQGKPDAYYYEYWSNIRHPETGETLQAVKGYCNPDNLYQCYYAEYRDNAGNYYHYLDSRYYHDTELRGTKSISQQQLEDAAELERKLNSQKHKEFFEESSSVSETRLTEVHQNFFDGNDKSLKTESSGSMATNLSGTKTQVNGNVNDR